ncbi:interleukin-7 isoform X3 [Erinaceus europaeus]|uniref:Interleukin-7 n=1 Tax=Erinaceus europaeus TaxID=9365 RepID=A0ABM3Y3U9_ERIEU|nr:interleukin-7 isoform X3 [Erinaceus europaeus]
MVHVASSDCDIGGKDGEEYESVIMVSINYLDNMLETDSSCLNNESNFFKKHSCDDNKEAVFLNRAAHRLNKFKMNISEDFNIHLLKVSRGTLTLLLKCKSKVKERKLISSGEAQPTKNLEENRQKCLLKILLQKIKTCWNKILKEHAGTHR